MGPEKIIMLQQTITVRESTLEEDSLIAQHFYQMWKDNDVPDEAINPNWLNKTLNFIKDARTNLDYQGFVAEIDHRIVGSASCQIFAGLYANVLQTNYRKYGYIWGVYVEPPYRRQGIATQLTLSTINHLKAIACTKVILNASTSGKPIYESLGFTQSNTMQLDLM